MLCQGIDAGTVEPFGVTPPETVALVQARYREANKNWPARERPLRDFRVLGDPQHAPVRFRHVYTPFPGKLAQGVVGLRSEVEEGFPHINLRLRNHRHTA